MSNLYKDRNISMMMDFYELTMANGYFKNEDNRVKVAFDVFYRKNPDGAGFSIFAGLEQIIEYITNIHFEEEDIEYLRNMGTFDEDFLAYLAEFKFTGDVYAFPEGTIMYPNEPVITVVASLIDAQLIETGMLNTFNHQSLIATKANRIVKSAEGRPIFDFGGRRAQGIDAANYGARAAMIGGVKGTATVSAAQMLGVPAVGTMAHSWIMRFDSEEEAFRKYAELYPNNCILLADTYDVLKSGVPNAIKIFKEMQEKGIEFTNYGIRLDSGDLAYLSKKARKMFDEAGFETAKITASNSLDEFTIKSLLEQGACIDSFGVGERLITAKSDPVFGGVYKIAAVIEDGKMIPKIKISETAAKITNPGLKDVYRIYNEDGRAIADLLTIQGEEVDMSKPYRYVDPEMPWKNRYFENCKAVKLQHRVIYNGEWIGKNKTIQELSEYVKHQLSDEIWEEEQRFDNPHKHYLDMSPAYYEMKMDMLNEHR